MKVKKLNLVYFSPTNTTERVVKTIAKSFDLQAQQYDLTQMQDNIQTLEFTESDLVIIGIPVYSGRVPITAVQRFHKLKGNHTPAGIVVTYGNRDYDDALIELQSIVEESGFKVVGAAAIVTEHSIAASIGAGRPDQQDIHIIKKFGNELREKIANLEDLDKLTLQVKGNRDYRKYQVLPICPHGDSNCIKCGVCAGHCPVGAISAEKPDKTNKDRCICCMRCIKICPQKARKLSKMELFAAEKLISSKCNGDKQPELFI